MGTRSIPSGEAVAIGMVAISQCHIDLKYVLRMWLNRLKTNT